MKMGDHIVFETQATVADLNPAIQNLIIEHSKDDSSLQSAQSQSGYGDN